MCGINGIFAYQTAAPPPDRRELLTTRDAMRRRGPDGAGAWWSADGRAALAHRRLSIVDLTEAGAQPMVSGDGALAVTFNGEIYNYRELRRTLEAEGRVFVSDCDTEVLLHLYASRGEAMVHALRGMFAFAIWDDARRGLFLARDPYGIKPLYVADDGWTFRFASQVKALLAGGGVASAIEPAGVVGFLMLGSVPEPFTIHRGIRALPAGHTQWIGRGGATQPRCYASVASILASRSMLRADGPAAAEILRSAVADSVREHLMADVDVGVFLSAGIDSGAVLGLARDAGQMGIRGITLAFREFVGTQEDEAPLAAEIAALYDARHTVRVVDEAEFRDDLPAILACMDQPSIDGVNTWFVAKAAREQGLKVVLSGLGGDELLGGYGSFRDVPRWVSALRVPSSVPYLGSALRVLLRRTGWGRGRPKLPGLVEFGGTYSGAYLLRRGLFLPYELDEILDRDLVVEGLRRLDLPGLLDEAWTPDPKLPALRVAALESGCYMRNQLLRDADWAGMAHGVEIRTPLVDATLLREAAPCLPDLAGRKAKMALAAAPSRPLPRHIAERAKTGFLVPTRQWLMREAAAGGTAVTKGMASRAWALRLLEFERDRSPALPVTVVIADQEAA